MAKAVAVHDSRVTTRGVWSRVNEKFHTRGELHATRFSPPPAPHPDPERAEAGALYITSISYVSHRCASSAVCTQRERRVIRSRQPKAIDDTGEAGSLN